jgi:PAS domain S-box-containing protein
MPYESDEREQVDRGRRSILRTRVADAILNAAADAVVACDRDGIICFWNPGASRIFGFTEDEALGQSLDIIIPERLQARHWDGFHHLMSSGRSRYAEGHLLSAPGRRKDGSQVSIEFTVVTLKDDQGRVANIVATMRDITPRFEELKALRQQLRTNAPG